MKGREVFENIPEEAARELEAIVGPEWISTDPNICRSSFGQGWGYEIYLLQGVSQPPAAVVMPKSTDEVARIVKVCNRYDLPFKPVGTHTVIIADAAFLLNSVMIDMKRMNSFEIDEKNMYAYVEAGVIAAEVSAEANKRDMYYVITGGGAHVTPLSNHFAFGMGHLCWRATVVVARRINGFEWVSPEGEIYRFGSFATGDEWFWGDGLGPQASGIMQGFGTWSGAMGIVTRASFKLYPFQPEPLVPEGLGHNRAVALPPRVRYYNSTFPSKEALAKAIDEIGRADIGYVVNIAPAFWRTMAKAKGARDLRGEFLEAWEPETVEGVRATNILRVCLVGRTSLKQLEYEERVLMDIIEENGGTPRRTPQRDEATFRYANTADMWMPTNGIALIEGFYESTRCIKAENELFSERLFNLPHKLDYIDIKGDLPWYLMFNRARMRYCENHAHPDVAVTDPEAPEFDPEYTGRFVLWAIPEGPTLGIRTGAMGCFMGAGRSFACEGPAYHNYDVWLTRVQEEFNPKGLSGVVWPYAIDKVLAATPPAISEELKETVKKAVEAGWKGNPE